MNKKKQFKIHESFVKNGGEKYWQKYWQENRVNYCDLSDPVKSRDIREHGAGKTKPKFYNLVMFPYPSGDKIHIGHGYNYTGSDVYGRYKRMKGFNVFEPMGYDAFGLPAENYAIKTRVHPTVSTKKNTEYAKKQLIELGTMYDWDKEINTSSPEYYKWTQWIFNLLYKAGLAYQAEAPVNWCPSCKTVLANEQVINGKCERCGSQVIQKNLNQWFFKITAYAERLLEDHKKLNWPEKTIMMQRNWIGKSEGMEVEFRLTHHLNGGLTNLTSEKLWAGQFAEQQLFFVTFPTYKRIWFFENDKESKKIIKIFDKIIKDKNYQVIDLVVMPEHIHLIVNRKKHEDLEKIIKDIKGISSYVYSYKEGHLWAKSFEYEEIKDQKSLESFLNYLRKNPEKQNLKSEKRLLSNLEPCLKVFTTRPDTLFGVTFMVVAPEHPLVTKLLSLSVDMEVNPPFKWWVNLHHTQLTNQKEIEKYIEQSKNKSELERTDLAKEKTGVELKGVKAINPVNNKEIPIYVADYVLPHYGTGAIMAVPAHDERDFEFAKKFGLKIVPVVKENIKIKKYGNKEIKGRQKTALIIHGFEGMANSNWFPWAKEELKCLGFEVILLDMPNSYHPKLEEWLEFLEPYKEKIGENSLVIGHSLGGPVAAHFVSNLSNKVKGLYLTAPANEELDFDKFRKEYFESDIDSLEKICKTPIDWQKIKRNSEYIFGFISNNDDTIPLKKTEKIFKTHHIDYQILNNKGHIQEPPFYELIDHIMANLGYYDGEGIAINSDQFNGLTTQEFKEKITKWLGKRGLGRKAVNYKLRDWLISRQRYWGAPIPVIYCRQCAERNRKQEVVRLSFKTQPNNCHSREMLSSRTLIQDRNPETLQTTEINGVEYAIILVPEKDLPVKLPDLKDFKPTDKGESPLARVKEFINVKCPRCGSPAKRSTETMDTFVCSSWYFLRFLSPHLKDKLFDKKLANYWLPVDQYCGGAEHACMHLLYARFITKVLYDQKLISFDEPFTKLNHQGMILAHDGTKMSKSKGNVVIPDDYIKKYGADVFRLYVLFLAPFEQGGVWNDKGIMGVKRFLDRVWKLQNRLTHHLNGGLTRSLQKLLHQTIKKVSEDIENFHFNTAISQMMIFVNEVERAKLLVKEKNIWEKFLILLAPFAPHIAEELWHSLDEKDRKDKTIFNEPWPDYNPELIKEDEVELVIQVNGKLRDKIKVPADILEQDVEEDANKLATKLALKLALKSEKIQKWLQNKEPKKIIYIKGKLINIVL